MKKPQYQAPKWTPEDIFSFDIWCDDEITLGEFREKTKGFPDSCKIKHEEYIEVEGYSPEYQARLDAAKSKYDEDVIAYDTWYKTTPEYLEQVEWVLKRAQEHRQFRIKELQIELEKLQNETTEREKELDKLKN